jgi:hypothetical protein
MQFEKALLAMLMLLAAAVRADYQFEPLAPQGRSSIESKREGEANEVSLELSPQKVDYEEGGDEDDEGDDIEFDVPVRF